MNNQLFEHRQIILNVYEPVTELNNENQSILSSILLLQLQHDYGYRAFTKEQLKGLEREGFEFNKELDSFLYKCLLGKLNVECVGSLEENNEMIRLNDWNIKEIAESKSSNSEASVQLHEDHHDSVALDSSDQVSNKTNGSVPSEGESLVENLLIHYEKEKDNFYKQANGYLKYTKETFSVYSADQIDTLNRMYAIIYSSDGYKVSGKRGNDHIYRHPLAAKLSIVLIKDKEAISILHDLDHMDDFDELLYSEMRDKVAKGMDNVDRFIFDLIDDCDLNDLMFSDQGMKNMYDTQRK